MDNQFSPQQSPQQPPQPAPTVTQSPVSVSGPKRSKKGPLLTLLVILLIGAAAGGVYYWQNQKVKDLDSTVASLNTKVTALNKELASAEDQASKNEDSAKAASTDDQVLVAVKNYCNANVDPDTKKPLVLKVGTSGTSQKKVLYSADKNFASVNAVCSKDGTTEGSGSAYYLKKVNDAWVFLYRGQMTSPEDIKQFNIPSDFS